MSEAMQSTGGHGKRARFHAGLMDDSTYSAAEFEFQQAMEAHKKEHHIRFPTLSDYLDVLLSLGYRKTAPRTEEKRPRRFL